MSHTDPQTVGRAWEQRAAEFLRSRGVEIMVRGYRCRLGELDIIGIDEQALVIVEVRARGGDGAGSAAETIGHRKRRRIVNATRHFMMRNPEWSSRRIRFDVIAIDRIDTSAPELRWIRNAFDAS